MIPTGTIYASIRADMLDQLATTPIVSAQQAEGLRTFFTGGSFVVTKASKKQIVFEAAVDDISSLILLEAELLIDHCIEQLNEIVRLYLDTSMRSDAWGVVTIYYFGYFSALVLLRLLGEAVVYIDDEIINIFAAFPAFVASPGAGAYYLEKGSMTGSDRAEYFLRKSKQKIHESTWLKLFTYALKKAKLAVPKPDAAEAAFYSNLRPAVLFNLYEGNDWPAVMRAKANYKAGFAYKMTRNQIVAKSKSVLSVWEFGTPLILEQQIKRSYRSCQASSEAEFDKHVQFLFDLSLTLFLLGRQLYSELLDRRRLDRRWEQRRKNLKAKMLVSDDRFTALLPIYV